MKGTIAILGCLFAAYAAPLFANEVPLILDETIQMPMATPYWDVAPTWSGDYYWASANGDTLGAFVSWGSVRFGDLNRLNPSVGFGWVNQITILFSLQNEIVFIVSRGGTSSPPWVFSSCNVGAYRVAPIEELIRYNHFVGHYYTFPYTEVVSYLSVSSVYPNPSPPDLSETAMVSVKYEYSYLNHRDQLWEHTESARGVRFLNFLDTTSQAISMGYYWNTQNTSWAGGQFTSVSGWNDTYNQGGGFTRAFFSSLYELSHGEEGVEGYDLDHFLVAMTTFHEPRRPILLARDWATVIAFNENSETLWSIPGISGIVMAAYVLIGEHTEQFLLIDQQTRQFNIALAETGQIWGQTSPLDSGYSEMKIIGRYHNETRRLVVRYGSELRIYRFGEPILDADDARPELPSELSLSAYPNPFNPTTKITFDLPKATRAKLVVYDLNGRLVQTLLDEQMSGGHHEFGFDGAALPSGIYFARLSAGDLVRTQKMVLLK